MSIYEDLVATCVPEAASLLLVAEQSVREPGEGPELCLTWCRSFAVFHLVRVLSCVS